MNNQKHENPISDKQADICYLLIGFVLVLFNRANEMNVEALFHDVVKAAELLRWYCPSKTQREEIKKVLQSEATWKFLKNHFEEFIFGSKEVRADYLECGKNFVVSFMDENIKESQL